jgi:hypothetical protein
MTTDNEETPSLYSARRQLEDMRYRYGKSRPAATTLLQQFSQILDIAEETMAQTIEAKEREIDIRYQGRLEQATAQQQAAWARVNQEVDKVAELQEILRGKRSLQEEREREGDDVKVSIDRGVGGWTVADIEEIAYRLRGGGAVDDTPVHLSTTRVVSHVPDPNVVTLGGGQEVERPHPATMVAEAGLPWRKRDTLFMAMLALGALVGILGLTVW